MKPSRLLGCPSSLLIAVVLAGLAASGCSSAEDKVYESYKCAKIAAGIGEVGKARAAAAKAEPYMKELKVTGSQFQVRMMDRFTDDLELHRLSTLGQGNKLTEIFESTTCQKLYQ